jgi:UDP-glucuronate decarboxylase
MNSNDGRVVSNFIVQALKGDDITIFGDGTHTRSFQYIDDLISGLIKLMSSPDTFTGPVNLGNPVEVSVGDLAKKIIKMTGSKSKLIYLPLPEDDPKQRKPDISLAKKELNWQPVVDLETGLGRTIEYFRSI